MIRKVSAEDIAIRGNGTGLEYMCPTRHFVYIFFNPVFRLSTAKNEINLFNNHVLIVAPVTFAPAGAMTPSAEFLFYIYFLTSGVKLHIHLLNVVVQFMVFLTLSTLICRGTDISRYISEFLGIRDNESRLYCLSITHIQ